LVGAVHFEEAANRAWCCGGDGVVRSLRVLGLRLREHGGGWGDLVAAIPAGDGLSVLVVTGSGGVRRCPVDGVTPATAESIADLPGPVVAATLDRDGRLLVLRGDGHIVAVDVESGLLAPIAVAPAGSDALLADPGSGEIWTGEQGASSLIRLDSAGDLLTPSLDTDAEAERLTWGTGGPWCRWHSLVISISGTTIRLTERGDDVTDLPVEAGPDPLAAGGWAPMTVDYDALGLAPEDVAWRWVELPDDPCVSAAKPPGEEFGRYEHRVLACPEPGELTLEASERASGTVLATRRFRVLGCWPDREVGAPQVLTGARQVYAKAGWGGGPAGPQNIRTHPAPEEYRIAVAVLRCKGTMSGVDAGARVDQLKVDVVDTAGPSVDRFYREASFANTPASASAADPKGTRVRLLGDRVFGPIDVDYAFPDLFSCEDPDAEWPAWLPNGGTWDVLAGTFSTAVLNERVGGVPLMDLADAVVLTVLPATDDKTTVAGKAVPAQWTWALAGDAQIYWKPNDLSTTFTRVPAVVMPAAMPAMHPAPWTEGEFVSTIVHELGHDLGMPDLYGSDWYPAEIGDRYIDGFDIMADDRPMPHFSLPHRMRLGWVNPSWIEVCDFGKNPASRTVTLQAVETLSRTGPNAGQKAGVEVRLRDGWNYYFEYRSKQDAQQGDQKLKQRVVLGTDVFLAAAEDMARPLILKLPKDLDNDGPTLLPGQDYEESDVTNPDRMNDFRITRRNVFSFPGAPPPTSVTVDIEYVGAHRPELQITPAPGRGDYKSPDIDLDGPSGPNVAVKGRRNTIKVRVHNRGSKAADKVQVRVQWLPFTTSAGPWRALTPPKTQPIPAKATREFTVDWDLPESVQVGDVEAEHFCVRVDVDRYVDPTDPAGSEIVVHNNWAQSNFTTATVGHGSPSDRLRSALVSTNPYPVSALHRHVVEQTGELFRAYLDHGWSRVDAGETALAELAYESLAGDPQRGEEFMREWSQTQGETTTSDLTVRSFLRPAGRREHDHERFGVGIALRAGRRTRIVDVDARGEVVQGRVLAEDTGSWVEARFGEVRAVTWAESRPEDQLRTQGSVAADGTFFVGLPGEMVVLAQQERVYVEVFYVGNHTYAASRSEIVPLET